MYLGLGLRLTRASALLANTSLTLDANAVLRTQTLDADALSPRLRIWNNDPAYADRVGRYSAGGPQMALENTAFANIFTFARASTATDTDAYGLLNTVAAGNIRQGYSAAGAPLGWLLEGAATNLLLNSATLTTQSVTVAATQCALSFYGTGTVTLSGTSTAGPLVGTGAASRVSLIFTPTAGSLTLTVTGTVTNAQLEANYFASSYVPTTGAATTRQADALTIDGARFQQIFGLGKSVTNAALQSQTLDNATWTKTNATVTADATAAPDGTTTADKISDDATNGQHQVTQTASFAAGSTYTLSIYGKAAERTWLRVALPTTPFGTSPTAYFDLSAGTISSVAATATPAIQSLSNGWFRCSVTATATVTAAAQNFGCSPAPSAGTGSYVGDGSGVYVWGAQLETTPTTPAANLLTAPEAFGGTGWGKSAATVTSFATTAPDGGLADMVSDTAANTIHYITQVGTITAGATVTQSIYAKAGTASLLQIGIDDSGANGCHANFNLASGTVGLAATLRGTGTAIGATITAVAGAAGWYRCTLTGTIAPAATAARITVVLIPAAGSGFAPSYLGTGTGLYLWGANLAQASAAPAYVPLSALVSSYIPTTTAAVTKTGITEGAVIVEAMMPQLSAPVGQTIIQLADGGSTLSRLALFNASGGSTVGASVINLGASVATPSAGAITAGTVFRAGIKWGPGAAGGTALSVCLNGGAVQTVFGVPSNLSQLYIGNNPPGSSPLNGRMRRVWAAAFAPTDAQLTAATVAGADVDAAIRS